VPVVADLEQRAVASVFLPALGHRVPLGNPSWATLVPAQQAVDEHLLGPARFIEAELAADALQFVAREQFQDILGRGSTRPCQGVNDLVPILASQAGDFQLVSDFQERLPG